MEILSFALSGTVFVTSLSRVPSISKTMPFSYSRFVSTEDNGTGLLVHAVHNRKGLQTDSLGTDDVSAYLEALLNDNTSAHQLCSGFLQLQRPVPPAPFRLPGNHQLKEPYHPFQETLWTR